MELCAVYKGFKHKQQRKVLSVLVFFLDDSILVKKKTWNLKDHFSLKLHVKWLYLLTNTVLELKEAYPSRLPFVSFVEWRRTSKMELVGEFSLDLLAFFFLVAVDSPFEIEDCIRLNKAIISAWLDDIGCFLSEDWDFESSSSFSVLPGAELFRGGLPLLLPSDFMLETLN